MIRSEREARPCEAFPYSLSLRGEGWGEGTHGNRELFFNSHFLCRPYDTFYYLITLYSNINIYILITSMCKLFLFPTATAFGMNYEI